MHITLQPAYILHSRPYRETSILLDVFTQEYGRLSLLGRGVRTQKSRLKSLLQPFIPLLISWRGKSELVTLYSAEMDGIPPKIQGKALFNAFYVNEVLFQVLQKHDPYPELYTIYQRTLLELEQLDLQEKTLRLFEKKLLEQLGYGLPLKVDFSTGNEINSEKFYQFFPERGFTLCESTKVSHLFLGKSLLALAQEKLDDKKSLDDVKRLMRIALIALLNLKPLQTRKLYLFNTKKYDNILLEGKL